MLGIIRIYSSRMSSFRNTIEDLYGYACKSSLLSTLFCSETNGGKMGVGSGEDRICANMNDLNRDRKLRRRIRLITISRGCIRILLDLRSGSEGCSSSMDWDIV